MPPSRNVDSWKKSHLANSESAQLYADPVPEVMSFEEQGLDEEDDILEILQPEMNSVWDVTAFNRISVVTANMEKAPDVKFDVQFPTSFNFTEDIFTTDNLNDGERPSTPIPMTPDSNRSFNLEVEDPPVISTERKSDDAESEASDVFDDLLVDDTNGIEIPTITSESGIVICSNPKDMAEPIPEVVYSSSDSEDELADRSDKEMNEGHKSTSSQITHHRDQPKRLSFLSFWKTKKDFTDAAIVEIDSEFSGSPESPPTDDYDCDITEDNGSDEESSDEDDIVPTPERKKTSFLAIRRRRRRSRENDDPNFFEDFAEEFFTCSYFFKCLGECAIEKGCSNGKEVEGENNDTKFVDGETNDDKPVVEMEEEAHFEQ